MARLNVNGKVVDMAAAALLHAKPKPTDADIDSGITNICRCGTFNRVRKGIHLAAGKIA
jgi:isoquinoline 1-oxidoreductase alpha subunit